MFCLTSFYASILNCGMRPTHPRDIQGMPTHDDSRHCYEPVPEGIVAEEAQVRAAPFAAQFSAGKAAEQLRRVPAYRKARTVMVSPSPLLRQVRLNTITDRKRLILPTPGLKDGFLRTIPLFISPRNRNVAIQPRPGNPWALRIPYDQPMETPIDLIVTECTAAGLDGSRRGDGAGHFDLQCAILASLGWLSPSFEVAGIAHEDRICSALPMKPTDMSIHWIVTPAGALSTGFRLHRVPGLDWGSLVDRDIRRNQALFYLFRKLCPGGFLLSGWKAEEKKP